MTRKPVLLGISLGYFMVLLDMTVLSVAEPDLARSLGGSVAGLQWTVSAYTVVFGALLPSAGAVADRYGAHRVFRAGIVLFGAGSLLCACAPGLWTLVALRGVLGVAGAACVPASMALIARLYPVPAERARAVATWVATSGAALAAGPLAGGVLVGLWGWRAIFLVNVPLAGVVLWLTRRVARVPRGERPVDWTAQLMACAAVGLLTDALIAFGSGTALHGTVASVGAAAAGAGFAVRQRTRPMLPRTPGLPSALVTGAAVNLVMSALLFLLPLVLHRRLELGPVETGLAFLPMTVPFAVNPLLTGRIVARVGTGAPIAAGLALLAASGLVFAAAGTYPAMVGGLLCAGFGVSFALPALATRVVAIAPEGAAGTAGGLLNAARQVGASVGVAAMGPFVASETPAFLLLAGVAAAALLARGAVR